GCVPVHPPPPGAIKRPRAVQKSVQRLAGALIVKRGSLARVGDVFRQPRTLVSLVKIPCSQRHRSILHSQPDAVCAILSTLVTGASTATAGRRPANAREKEEQPIGVMGQSGSVSNLEQRVFRKGL